MKRSWRQRILGARCRDVVGWLTDYIEGALDPHETAELDRHMTKCDGCSYALAQFRQTIVVTGELSSDEVMAMPVSVQHELRAAFEAHHT